MVLDGSPAGAVLKSTQRTAKEILKALRTAECQGETRITPWGSNSEKVNSTVFWGKSMKIYLKNEDSEFLESRFARSTLRAPRHSQRYELNRLWLRCICLWAIETNASNLFIYKLLHWLKESLDPTNTVIPQNRESLLCSTCTGSGQGLDHRIIWFSTVHAF